MKKTIPILLALLLIVTGCSAQTTPPSEPTETTSSEPDAVEDSSTEQSSVEPEQETVIDTHGYPTPQEYIAQVVQDNIDEFYVEGMSEYEMVKAAYDHIIQKSTHTKAVALDSWRWRSVGDYDLTYLEQRSLGILLYGRDNCYGFAAALYMLLDGMGLEARYLPGFTYTNTGAYCDHAWNQVRIDGVWYHMDPDLDGLVRRSNVLSYRYFLNSDATMSQTHFWGQSLINLNLLEDDQHEDIAAYYMGENCPQDHPKPAAHTIVSEPTVDKDALEAELLVELAEYEALFGKLEPMTINWLTPIFGHHEGYNSDARPEFSRINNRSQDRENVVIRSELRAPALAGMSESESKALGREQAQTVPQTSDTLLIYFSHSDDIGTIADSIAASADLDRVQIIPIQSYPSDHRELLATALQEVIDVTRPEIENLGVNIDNYDTILLGFPVWHATVPMPVATFLESNDFTGKTIAPFYFTGDLYGTSAVDRSISDLTTMAPEGHCGIWAWIYRKHIGGCGRADQAVAGWIKPELTGLPDENCRDAGAPAVR